MLNELQNAMVVFSSTSTEDVADKTQYGERVVNIFGQTKEAMTKELGVDFELAEQKITADFLKKLISESFKK